MARRRDARRLAAGILHQADVSGRDPVEVLEERKELGERVPGFTEELVRGVTEKHEELDRLIASHSDAWPVSRMPVVDRTLIRIACYELLYRDDVPTGAVISQAVEAAKELSTDDSSRFINGILGKIASERTEAG
ncbi:MAG: transcription antitermination factor NusB [Actinomycetota bacterium]